MIEPLELTNEVNFILEEIEKHPGDYCVNCKKIAAYLKEKIDSRNKRVLTELLKLVEGYPLEAKQAFCDSIMKHAQV